MTKEQLMADVDSVPKDCELVSFPIPMVPVESVLNLISNVLLPDLENGPIITLTVQAIAGELDTNREEAVVRIMNAARRASALQLTLRLKELSHRNEEAAKN